MDVHLWRVPTLLGVTASSALLLFAALVVASAIRRTRPSLGMTAATSVALVLFATFTAILVKAAATRMARSLDISLAYVEPGLMGYLAPMMFAVFAFAAGKWMLRGAWGGRRALLFYIWLFGFTVANVINRCSPGWCATIGFPFTWQSSSDTILTFENSELISWLAAAGQVVGGALNLLVFAGVGLVLTRSRFRGRPDRPLQPTSGASAPRTGQQ